MTFKEIVYISALLHDIGRFIERVGGYYEDSKKFENDFNVSREYAQRLYYAFYIDKFDDINFKFPFNKIKMYLINEKQ
jgi:HD superfamily phosphodiesterase